MLLKRQIRKQTLFCFYSFQSKLFRLQQKLRCSNVLQSIFCTWLHSLDTHPNRVTYQYFKENDIISPKQFGFQVNNSMYNAILNLTNDILTSFKTGQFTLEAFIDLSNAFDTVDTVNHSILLHKLNKQSKCLNWFKSYLKHRQQLYYSVKMKMTFSGVQLN